MLAFYARPRPLLPACGVLPSAPMKYLALASFLAFTACSDPATSPDATVDAQVDAPPDTSTDTGVVLTLDAALE